MGYFLSSISIANIQTTRIFADFTEQSRLDIRKRYREQTFTILHVTTGQLFMYNVSTLLVIITICMKKLKTKTNTEILARMCPVKKICIIPILNAPPPEYILSGSLIKQ